MPAVGSHMPGNSGPDCDVPVERNINSPSSNAKSRRDGNAAAWSVAATKKRPKPSRLAVTCRYSVAQSSLEMLYLLQNACVASVSPGNQPSCSRCVVPSPSTTGMVSSALQMHARATSRNAQFSAWQHQHLPGTTRRAHAHRWSNARSNRLKDACHRF